MLRKLTTVFKESQEQGQKLRHSLPTIFNFPFYWFSNYLVAVNLLLFSRVLTKLILTIFAEFLFLLGNGAVGAAYSPMFADITSIFIYLFVFLKCNQ